MHEKKEVYIKKRNCIQFRYMNAGRDVALRICNECEKEKM